MPKIVRMNLFRRHPIALTLLALVVISAFDPLPALVDPATGAPPADADLTHPLAYVVAAPFSDVLDALTFLSLDRARALLAAWVVGLAAFGALRPGPPPAARPFRRAAPPRRPQHRVPPRILARSLGRRGRIRRRGAGRLRDRELRPQGARLPRCPTPAGAGARRRARSPGGRCERQPRLGEGHVRVEPRRLGSARVPLQPGRRPAARARPGRMAAVDGGLHAAVAHVPKPVVERALQLDHVDPRGLHLSGGTATRGRRGWPGHPGALARGLQAPLAGQAYDFVMQST